MAQSTALPASTGTPEPSISSEPDGTPQPAGTFPATALPPIAGASPLTQTSGITETLQITETPSRTGTPSTTEPPQPTATLLPVVTTQPLDVFGPASSLELTPTSQLTLSPVIFIENTGQFTDSLRFQVRGAAAGGIWLAPEAIWMTLLEPAEQEFGLSSKPDTSLGLSQTLDSEPQTRQGVLLKFSFVGANPYPQLVPFDRLDTQVSYFGGNDPAHWHTEVPVWGGVRYLDLYPGVDLELTSTGEQYTQRLVVHPGADLGVVRLRVGGADALALEPLPQATDEPETREGAREFQESPNTPSNTGYYLRLTTILGQLSLPLLQVVTADGSPLETMPSSVPRIVGDGSVVEFPFSLPDGQGSWLDDAYPPVSAAPDAPTDLLYLTFLGKGGNDRSHGIAVDEAGNAHVTGHTYFPTTLTTAGPFDATTSGRYDVSVIKMNADGTKVAYATFLGGNDHETGSAIAVDGDGNAYVTGVTRSSDLPATAEGFDTKYDDGYDAFVIKLNADGTELRYATFLGGQGHDQGRAIAVDEDGNAYVTGYTASSDFPATAGAWDTGNDGQDAFVVKLNALGTGLAYATFLGGNDVDQGNAIAVDGIGSAYVTGATRSSDFATTTDSFDASYNGDDDAFVVKVNQAGTELVYATFLGGQSTDYGRAIAVDGTGQAYLAGATRSSDFATTAWSFDASYAGGYDAFVIKMNTDGDELSYATFLGGIGDDWGQALAIDDVGHAYVTGSTQGLALPGSSEALTTTQDSDHDAFIVRVDELGTELAYATLLGGSGEDHGQAIAVDAMGSAYIAGMTAASHFGSSPEELTPGSLSQWNAFLSKQVVGTPFLDLPVAYSNFARSALGNVGDRGPGRVNSWFDHRYPNHVKNQKMTRWDGATSTISTSSPPRIGENWYDGHGGTDFRWDELNEPIFAAAPGIVIDTVTTCRAGNQACGNYFGNRVWIDHGNGYATVYAHLKTVHVSPGTVIVDPASQPLGIMGNTGRSLGTHLHFGLYFDRNGDGRWGRDETLDPYGWAGSGKDPWDGPNRYLWKQPLWTRHIVEASLEAVALSSPSNLVNVTIPTEALTSTAVVELWDMPPAAKPAAEWRSTGHSFLLTGERLDGDVEDNSLSLAQPITLSMTTRQRDMQHLAPGRLTLRRWDESRKAWASLPTTVITGQNRIVAQATEFGRFDLHAPLLCPSDSQEPDDHYGAAQIISTDGITTSRVFDIKEDVDWFRFEARAGELYLVQIGHMAAGVEPIVRLYDSDSIRLLASGKNRAADGTPYFKWRALMDGAYLLQVSQAEGSVYGCDARYELDVRQVHALDSVAIAGPATGIIQTGYTFTATVNPVLATQPITYVWQIEKEPPVSFTGGPSHTITFTWSTTGTQHILVTATNAGGTVIGTHSIVVQPPVAAAFTALPTTGQTPLKVTFTNTSQGEYTSSLWDFGDGKTDRAQNPTHVYKATGVYTVTLTISGPGGSDVESKKEYITVEKKDIGPEKEYTVFLPIIVRRR